MLAEILQPLIQFFSDLIVRFGYFGIFAITFLENIIAPIPSEFVFPWAGFLASQGKMNIWLISLAGALGSLLAAWVLYYLGTRFNGPKTRAFVDKYGKFLFITLDDLEKSEKWFEKYGPWTILLFRVVPLGRSLISIPAGFVRMNLFLFSLFTFVGTFVWCFVLTYAGYVLGNNWDKVVELSSSYEHFILLIIVIAGLAFLFFKRDRVIAMFKKTPAPQVENQPTQED
jgi:membrane protein DedA with SNARE-associated domain